MKTYVMGIQYVHEVGRERADCVKFVEDDLGSDCVKCVEDDLGSDCVKFVEDELGIHCSFLLTIISLFT